MHIQRLFLDLHLDFASLCPVDSDSSPDLIAKIGCFGNFSPEHDARILEFCRGFLNRRDNVFVAVMSLFASQPSIVSNNLSTTAPMLKKILIVLDYNWVAQSAVVKLIGALNAFEIERAYREYVPDAVVFLVHSALSPQNNLAQNARTVAITFLGIQNLDLFIRELLKVDFFEPSVVRVFFLLVEELASTGSRHCFRGLLPLILELIRFWPDESFVTDAFFLVVLIPAKTRVRLTDIQCCQRHLERFYFAYPHQPLLGAEPVGEVQWSHSTDILANPTPATLDI
jgi:hypothetical protein